MMETVLISLEEDKTEQNPAYRPAAKNYRDIPWNVPTYFYSTSTSTYFTLNMESSIGTSISITSNDITPASIPFILATVFFGIITPLVSV